MHTGRDHRKGGGLVRLSLELCVATAVFASKGWLGAYIVLGKFTDQGAEDVKDLRRFVEENMLEASATLSSVMGYAL
jgi:hypothetical protein